MALANVVAALEGGVDEYTTPEGERWRRIRYPCFRRSFQRSAWAYVSSLGRLLSADGGRVLIAPAGKGYCQTTLAVKHEGTYGGQATTTVHRIVAYTFLGDPPSSDYTVDHLNRLRDDNRACNLAWASPVEQLSNRSSTRLTLALPEQGVVLGSVADASRALGVRRARLADRLRQAEAGLCVEVGGQVLRVEEVKRTPYQAPAAGRGVGYGAKRPRRGESRKTEAFLRFVRGESVAGVAAGLALARSTVLGYIGHCARSSDAAVLEGLAGRVGLGRAMDREALGKALEGLGQVGSTSDEFAAAYERAVRLHLPSLGDDWEVIRLVLRPLRGILDGKHFG